MCGTNAPDTILLVLQRAVVRCVVRVWCAALRRVCGALCVGWVVVVWFVFVLVLVLVWTVAVVVLKVTQWVSRWRCVTNLHL